MPDDAARAAGLMVVAPGVYLTSPTRQHVVLVQDEDGRWVAWAGRHDKDGRLFREWTLYQGKSLERALKAAQTFAGRLRR